MTEKTAEEFLNEKNLKTNPFFPYDEHNYTIEVMEEYALQEKRKAFEAGRTFVDAENSELRKISSTLDKLKYKNFEDYIKEKP